MKGKIQRHLPPRPDVVFYFGYAFRTAVQQFCLGMYVPENIQFVCYEV
jgi:hypothetical protein